MLKRSLRAAAVVVAALGTLVAVPVSAHAADGNITIPIDRLEANGAKTSVMTGVDNLQSGDCSMNVPSFVSLTPPTGTGTMLIQWEGFGYTRHTHNADVWNLYLNFLDASGNFVLSAPVMHGARMTTWYQVYGWDRYSTRQVTQGEFDRIAQVQWIGTC